MKPKNKKLMDLGIKNKKGDEVTIKNVVSVLIWLTFIIASIFCFIMYLK